LITKNVASVKAESILWSHPHIESRIVANGLTDRPDEDKDLVPAFKEWLDSKVPNNRARKVSLGRRPLYGNHWWTEEKEDLGQFKIDLVFYEGESVVVTEIETELNNSALGQALVYSHVYRDKKYNSEYDASRSVFPAVACCIAPTPYLDVASDFGVRVYYCRKGLTKSIKGKSFSNPS